MTDHERERQALELFAEICMLPAEEWDRALRDKTDNDPSLQDKLRRMLWADAADATRVDSQAGRFLASQMEQLTQSAPEFKRGDQVDRGGGQYRILRVIGEGGMSTVYEAEQVTPRRRVAIKAIRRGLRSPDIRRRFEHEARLMARLQHVGITRFYEADTRPADPGVRAYLAMEYIDGLPLDEYAERQELDRNEILRLFIKLCDAVEYAHRMGVIHRDLKPANVLVTRDGQPKVLDFGVGRAVEPDEALETQLTQHGQLIGTLAYMAPEQVNCLQVDERSDVYALGVILFKLLTQRLPIDVRRDGLALAARRIQEEKPRTLASIKRELKGDLEVIVARALAKSPERRYPSVRHLSDDVCRVLEGRPIDNDGAILRFARRLFGGR